MGFKFKRVNEITWPVTADVPQDGGKTEKHDFFCRFRYITRSEFNRIQALGEEALMRHVIVGVGETKEDIDTTEKTIREVTEVPYYTSAIYQAFLKVLIGAEAKN